MAEIINILLILVIGTQFGIALASSMIVHPILTEINRTSALEVFSPFFHKTHRSMITMSILVTLLAAGMWYLTTNWYWFGIALLMHLNGPYTLRFMMPTNNRLMANGVDPDSPNTIKDLKNWGSLHAVRTLWNGVIFVSYLILSF